ncbi:MAG: hypothetical protein PSV13_08205 [Lacunisphaera sp.]|nr:hypothetical protein [Lacunisphaera sp.]
MKNLGLLFAVCAAGLGLQADQRNDGPRDRRGPEPRIIVYQHANYRGSALVLYPGDELASLSDVRFEGGGRINDTISSIRIEGGIELYVYEDAGFRGTAARLSESVRDLTSRLLPESVAVSWNDRISSLRVERTRDRRPGNGPRPNPEVIIKRAYQDMLLREPDPTGLRHYRGLILDQGWTEEMVRDHLRRGDEFRREGADRIIRQAYRDVLDREPDASGLKQYRWALQEKDWTGDDVREDLKRSDEYRRRPVGPRGGEDKKPEDGRRGH